MEDGFVVFMLLYMLMALLLSMGSLLVLMAFYVVAYILEGKTLYAIANRRGLEKPWLAWVPVGSSWLLGCISDQYRYVVHGQERNRRKLLTYLAAVLYVVMTLAMTALMIWVVAIVASLISEDPEAIAVVYIAGVVCISVLMELMGAASAVFSVFSYMAYYDLFRSCDPGKSLVYLLVSIFTSYPLPFFLYSCRNKDLGMPPRRDAQEPQAV